MHEHNQWLCPAHVSGCGCLAPGSTLCNPYRLAGYCPDDISFMGSDDSPPAG